MRNLLAFVGALVVTVAGLGYYLGWYNEVMTQPIAVHDGHLMLAERPGLGTALREEVLTRPDAHVEVSSARNLVDMSKA